MYTTSKAWEKTFYLMTWFIQGSSFLVPRPYAVMHRMHHTFSDTEKDPHSPHFFRDILDMMMNTVKIFRSFLTGKNLPDPEFTREYIPVWKSLDSFGHNAFTRFVFMVGYTLFYIYFAPSYWWFLLLPIHYLMGPIQGAIVNWFGHKYGYSNFNNGDHSKNTTPFGVIMMGELFQNNHHKYKNSPNFAQRWFEFDSTFLIMKVLNFAGIIKLKPFLKTVEKPAGIVASMNVDAKAQLRNEHVGL